MQNVGHLSSIKRQTVAAVYGCHAHDLRIAAPLNKIQLSNCQLRVTRLTLHFTSAALDLKAYEFSLLSLFHERKQLHQTSVHFL
jgi:translation elongation factor EF-4